jgi:hypothetical protein
LSLFKDASSERYRAEASVWYLYSELAIDEILKFNPNAKFIVMLRNPIAMYFSLHRELLYGGSESEESPLKAWELQASRKLGKNIPLGCSDDRMLQYGEACKLGAQLKYAMEKIPKGQLMTIFMDDLKLNTDLVFRKVQEFLSVDEISLASYEIINQKKRRKSLFLSKVLILLSLFKRRLGIKKGLGLANAINKRNVTKDVKEMRLEESTLTPELLKYFDEDIRLLESITGTDLSHWKTTPQ